MWRVQASRAANAAHTGLARKIHSLPHPAPLDLAVNGIGAEGDVRLKAILFLIIYRRIGMAKFAACTRIAMIAQERDTNAGTGSSRRFRRFMCLGCGFLYDEERGWPEEGIAPGTRWEDIPAGWRCPDCGTAKAQFEMVEIPYYQAA